MTLRYRTTGAWGAGLGSNLTPANVDENFYTLAQEIAAWTAPAGVGIASITVAGNAMTIHMTDASTQGPFTLPTAAIRYREDWTPDTDYAPLDLFVIQGTTDGAADGLFLVLTDYHSEDSADLFDPNQFDTDAGQRLQFMLPYVPGEGGAAGSYLVIDEVQSDITLAPDMNGHYLTLSDLDTAPPDYNIQVPIDSFVTGTQIVIDVDTDSEVDINWDTEVTVRYPVDCIPIARCRGVTLTFVYLGENLWKLDGGLRSA